MNVLTALVDPAHIRHEHAHAWFAAKGARSWASCTLTEDGLIRILGHKRWPNSPGTAEAALLMARLVALPGHVFWQDEISLLNTKFVDQTRFSNASQVTDTYLLALACAKGGMLATFDHHLVASTVIDGSRALHLIA